MNKNLILTTFLLMSGYVLAMEEREKPEVEKGEPISPRVKTYLDKLPSELRDMINKYRIFELEQLPDELIITILSQLETGEYLKDEINAINNLRLVSKRFDKIINNVKFVDDMINYWSEKYRIKPAFTAVFWNIPGVLEWVKLRDKDEFDIMLKGEKNIFKSWEKELSQKYKFNLDSPLFLAVRLNRIDLIPILVKKGVDIDKDFRGLTPLIQAIMMGNEDLVKILLENGANPNKITEDGIPLTAAIYSDSLVKLLLEKGAEPNQMTTRGATALGQAIKSGNYDSAQVLLEKGADPNKKTAQGTPLELIRSTRKEIERLASAGYLSVGPQLELYKNPNKFIDLLKKYGAKE